MTCFLSVQAVNIYLLTQIVLIIPLLSTTKHTTKKYFTVLYNRKYFTVFNRSKIFSYNNCSAVFRIEVL